MRSQLHDSYDPYDEYYSGMNLSAELRAVGFVPDSVDSRELGDYLYETEIHHIKESSYPSWRNK